MPDFKNARPKTPIGRRNPVSSPPGQVPGKGKFVEARFNQGMITMIDPADIPPGAGQLTQNMCFRFDKGTRRPGTILFTPVKPNSNPVLHTSFFKKNNAQVFFTRFTRNSIHYRAAGGGSWTAVTAGVGGSLTGSDSDRFQSVTVLDRLVFANNGVDVLQEIDVIANQFKALGNAPKYKYVTGFANRVVGANLQGITPNPAQVGWSADGVPTEWDPLVNETAGFSPIVESTSDLGDFITGIFAFTNQMILLREQSVWLVAKQPIPQNPFYFYTAFPGLGCDCPDSAVIALNGLIWADQRSGSIWRYAPGAAEPERIGLPIEKDLMRGLDDPLLVFASYNQITAEYTVCIPQATSNFVKYWTYNLRTNAWSTGEYEGVTSLDDVDVGSSLITIDDLGDVPIDELQGTIDDLSPGATTIPGRIFGRSDGELIIEDENSYTDPIIVGSTFNGKFTSRWVSKSFSLPQDDVYVAELRINILPLVPANISLYFSRDGGATWRPVVKNILPGPQTIGKSTLIRWVRQVKARRYAFKLECLDGQFEVLDYEVHVHKAGESTR